jgi:hypothetical protein
LIPPTNIDVNGIISLQLNNALSKILLIEVNSHWVTPI